MRKLMRARKAVSKVVLTSESLETIHKSRIELARIEAEIKRSFDFRRDRVESEALSRMKTDPKYFYQFAKKNSKIKSEIGPICLSDGTYTCDKEEMAEALSAQYSSMFSSPREMVDVAFKEELFPKVASSPPPSLPSEDPLHHEAPALHTVSFSEDKLRAAIQSLSSSAAPGPDGIPTMCYKWGGTLIIEALGDIFSPLWWML